jgi:putative oxidoreductase
MDIGLLILRLVVGLALAAHGSQKLFGWFGGYGIAGTGGFLESIGFRPGKVMAVISGLGETAGGLGLALGVLTPLSAALVIATMLVAIYSVHIRNGFFITKQGYEYNLVLIASALALAFAGPGSISFDAAVGLSLAGSTWGAIAVALAVLGALPPLVSRTAPAQAATK